MIQNECSTFCTVLPVSSTRKQLKIFQFGQHAYYQLPIQVPTMPTTKESESPRLKVMALEKTNQNVHELQLSSLLRMWELLISICLAKKNQILNTQQPYFFLYRIPELILWTLLLARDYPNFSARNLGQTAKVFSMLTEGSVADKEPDLQVPRCSALNTVISSPGCRPIAN